MFQFRRLALSRVLYLQYSGLSHSEIYGYIACVQLPVAYRSLPRPSSPLKAKASAMCPYVALKKLKLRSVTTTKKLLGLQLLFSQYVKELSLPNRECRCADYESQTPSLTLSHIRLQNKIQKAAFKELIVEANGFEPMTPCVQGRCSSQLSYAPN